MSKKEKLLAKFLASKRVFPWNDLVTLLTLLGYIKKEMSGSRVRFFNHNTNSLLLIHKPHPENEIKGGALKSVKLHLMQEDIL